MSRVATRRHLAQALFGLALLSPLAIEPAAAGSRQALVIGNDVYGGLQSLESARHDASAIAEQLAGIGFEVSTVLDGDLDRMREAMVTFASSLDQDGVSLFYYAGHGVQQDGVNYLIPTDYTQPGAELAIDAVALDEVMTRVAGTGNRLAIYIIDACRDNPFVRTRGSQGGLAPIDAPYGSFVAYATAPGHVAYEGLSDGNHGVFTEAILARVQEPGLKLEEVFKLVRQDVVEATREQQVPWTSSSLVGDFFFVEGDPPSSPLIAALDGALSPPPADTGLPDEYLQWARIKDSRSVDDFDAFMDSYPDGDLYPLAMIRRDRLREGADARADQSDTCEACPEMVEVGPGTFLMGSDGLNGRAEPDEQPVHEVTIGEAFSISRHEITQAQFNEFVEATGYVPESRCGHPAAEPDAAEGAWTYLETNAWWQQREPKHAASCVSWLDAVSYTRWLSDVTGNDYRLPSEAEWEFAARGGERTERFWGDGAGEACRYANGYDETGAARFPAAKAPHPCTDGYAAIAPVGMFEPNGFALHDTLGNVAEWVLDCRTDNYRDAPNAADAWQDDGACAYRTLRGGSWHSDAHVMRAAYRDWTTPITRGSMIGFRVVRAAGTRSD